MAENNQSQILRAFLDEKFSDSGTGIDDESFKLIRNYVSMTEAELPESEQMRSIKGEKSTDGKYLAKHFSLYNITQISLHDLFDMLLKGAGVFNMVKETSFKIILAILAIAKDFYKHMNQDLNETEAKVLLAISTIKPDTFSLQDVQQAYQQEFNTTIEETELQVFLDAFKKMTILRFNPQSKLYSTRQNIEFTR